MIIISDKLTYKVTRYSATRMLKEVLADEFEKVGKYSSELRRSMLDEILEHTEFPAILDENRIFVYDENSKSFTGYKLDDKLVKEKKVFTIKDFSPKCKGTTLAKEAKAIFQKFSLYYLIGSSENGIQHPIVYCYNDECMIGEMDKNPDQVLTKAFKEVVGIENAEEVANKVLNKVFAGTFVFITFVNKGSEASCYALRSDGSVRKTSPFSVDSIYKAIMAELPKMKCTSEKAKTAAIYAHNKILYGIGLTDFELVSPADFSKEGKPVFLRDINGYTFWIGPTMENWLSRDMFSAAINQISWGYYEFFGHEDSTARSREYRSASYMGFSIVPACYTEAEPYFRTGAHVLCYDGLFKNTIREQSWTSYYGTTHNHRESIPVFDNTGKKSSLQYFGNISDVTDVLHFKLAAHAAILD